VSKEAYWYYKTNFSESLLIHPLPGLEITPTGYHPPLISIITAGLWKIFGYELWVSHAFTLFWAILLIYNSWKILPFFIPEKWAGWALLILLLESTVVTQFVISSPDFILLTAFVISLRAIFQRKPLWLAVGLVFLCGVNMRGVFAGGILFVSHFYYDFYAVRCKKYTLKRCLRFLLPYVPVFLLLSTYFLFYFSNNEWFFADKEGAYSTHYQMPADVATAIKHLAEFVLRLVENGRFVVWLLAAAVVVFVTGKNKVKLSGEEKMLGVFFVLITGLYLLFVFITNMPFSSRYFMIHYFVLSLLVLHFAANKWRDRKIRNILIAVLFFTVTGHCWIYPEKTAQCWESTLLHTPYYKLRKECFDYIDKNQIDYNDLSAGFCLYGNRGLVELKHEGKIVGASMDAKYFIYSNISNLADEQIDELKDTVLWTPVKEFRKAPVFITVYKKNLNPSPISIQKEQR
jgi:hypothetical protein